ncbi:hypothetical protein PAXRUDRAFT_24644 [Paxillus rubicundulus Ve08.2h10]|uniref:BHLH domain-containing protein n=1 Tax=Paxillus rubicundulus Ve08.2h10 TaxID=930991 RepID=A0A0D0E178_9AGAM|nr:hypothetical protein PAXRUDRAFT_24644 [Paxillus rubicundulus Ve08.2h10]
MTLAMSYPPLVKQEGFQLPSPAHTASSDDTATTSSHPVADSTLFMPHNISFLPDSFRKFPSAAQAHPHVSASTPTIPTSAIDFADELASLIDPHISSHERSTQSHEDAYRHNIFDIPAPTSHHHHHLSSSSAHPFSPPSSSANDIYHSPSNLALQTHFNASSIRYDPHPDPPSSFAYRHTPSPTHRSRSRSRGPSLGPTRSARRDRRANSISSHVSSTSPPPRPHPHAIVIPGRASGNPMGGFFVPGTNGNAGCAAPPAEYSLPTPDSLSHSFGFGSPQPHSQHPHSQYPYAAPSSPYYTYPINRTGTPSMSISPTDVETLSGISIGANGGMSVHHHHLSTPAHTLSSSIQPSSLPKTASGVLSSLSHVGGVTSVNGTLSSKTGHGIGGAKVPEADTHLSEKRRRRRESHNAVERRRRDNINERIGELAGLIPGVLFECETPLVVPGSPGGGTAQTAFGVDELFSMGLLGDSAGMHVLPAEGMDGLPELPEEGPATATVESNSLMKKDPSEDGESLHNAGSSNATNGNGLLATGGGVNGTANGADQTIKANKGMILRKSVEYIRYLQQLVSVQASRGRDLEERNRVLESEVAALRGSGEVSSDSTCDRSLSVSRCGIGSRCETGAGCGIGSGVSRLEGRSGELGSMPEDMEMDNTDDHDHDHERSYSCSRERAGADDDEEGENERRGRQRARGGGGKGSDVHDLRIGMMIRNGVGVGGVSGNRGRRKEVEGGDMEI